MISIKNYRIDLQRIRIKYIVSFEYVVKDVILWSILLLKRLEKKYFIRLYSTIDNLRAWNYIMIVDKGTTCYLRKGRFKGEYPEEMQLISNQLIDEFEMSDEYSYYVNKERSKNIMVCKYLGEDDRSMITQIKMKNRELESFKFSKHESLFKVAAKMSTFYKYRIDTKAISIKEFLYMVENFKTDIETKR